MIRVGLPTVEEFVFKPERRVVLGRLGEVNGEIRVRSEGEALLAEASGKRLRTPKLVIKARGRVLGMPVGKGFYWERREDTSYRGHLELYPEGREVRPVNVVEVEDYIASVVGSEMGDAPLEALKAQAVAARSTLLATYGRHHSGLFGICAEDHCQVYRGTAAETEASRRAAQETKGLVLFWGEEVADTRFSKCCGGVSEEFWGAWEPKAVPYLRFKPDGNFAVALYTEEDVRRFVDEPPPAFCSGAENFRWEVRVSAVRLGEVFASKTGVDLGPIRELRVLARSRGGRAMRLLVLGEKGKRVVERELEIRRVLSETYLNSALFYVEREGEEFVFRGAGWGHGVGMCQLGAAKLAETGWDFRRILKHYYPGTSLKAVEDGAFSRLLG